MDVLDIFVITEQHVYHTTMCAMEMHIVLMDLMKDIVVRHSEVHVNTLYFNQRYVLYCVLNVCTMYYTYDI